MTVMVGLGQAEARSHELYLSLPQGWQGPLPSQGHKQGDISEVEQLRLKPVLIHGMQALLAAG